MGVVPGATEREDTTERATAPRPRPTGVAHGSRECIVRQLRYSVAASLDGYIAGPTGEFDWIVVDPEIDFAAMYAGFSGLVMGRRAYEVFLATSGEGPEMPAPPETPASRRSGPIRRGPRPRGALG